jgi:signal peptidase I
LVVALFIAIVVRMFVLTAYKIPTTSMLPTLYPGDFVFAYRLPYGLQIPFANQKIWRSVKAHRGEVIVFRYPGDDSLSFIKRVAAVEGDKIEIKNRRLYVNDVPANYEKAPEAVIEGAGMDYYNVLRENIGESTRLVMFKKGSDGASFAPQVVPGGHIFVLGDNRDSSDDSRYWGMIPDDRVEGRVMAIWLSLDWDSRWGSGSFPKVRWERILDRVH